MGDQADTLDRKRSQGRVRPSTDSEDTFDVEDDDLAPEDDLEVDEEGRTITEPTKAQVNAVIFRKMVVNALLICSWFSLSMVLSIYNKWMFSSHDNRNGTKNLNFPFPLFTTSGHMLVQFIGSYIVLTLIPRFRPPKDHSLSIKDYTTRIGPCGVATGLDIGFSNASLKTITLAFYTMCKSSSLAFVLLFAFLFRLESPRLSLVGVIAIITVGVVLMVATETRLVHYNSLSRKDSDLHRFVVEGFVLVVTASAMGGLRWALTQILLKENPSTANPFSSIFHLAPIMFLSLVGVAMILEGPVALFNAALWHDKGLMAIPILLLPGVLAFLMTASEFGLIKRTSVVTLSVAGIFKEVLTIAVSAIVYGDELTPLNVSGLAVTILGIALYNYLRFKKMRKNVKKKVAEQAEQEQLHEPLVARTSVSPA